MNKIKFVFTLLALFHFKFNYSETVPNSDEKVTPIYNNSTFHKNKEVVKSNYTAKEKKLKNFKPSVNDETLLESFGFHEKQYVVNFPIDMVWDAYETTKPNECWAGRLTKYKQSYANSLFHDFQEENHPSFIEGSVYLIRLKVIPFVKINVVFQLNKLDRSKKVFELTYGIDNTSHGKQTIQFIADGEKTIIKHSSYFKSKSAFRDKHFYIKYHVKYIDEFHANIQNKLIDQSSINNSIERVAI
ncbi:MAG: hypothetical protein KAH07_08170 [Flavobacteriaceae bacterium]|nr:hypothetical protein [Flavobacteriaceae bacterium]